jgi:hypothetical protein
LISSIYDEFLQGYRSVYICQHCMISYTSEEVFESEEFAMLNSEVERSLHRALPHVLLEATR